MLLQFERYTYEMKNNILNIQVVNHSIKLFKTFIDF